jgi:cytochrome c553
MPRFVPIPKTIGMRWIALKFDVFHQFRINVRRERSPPMTIKSFSGVTSAASACLFAVAMLAPVGVAHAQGAAVTGNADAGRDKASNCVGCHEIPGYKTAFPQVYSVPMISGQTARYIEAALVAYRKGDRSHPTMRAIAASLSDQDIADLAALYGTK